MFHISQTHACLKDKIVGHDDSPDLSVCHPPNRLSLQKESQIEKSIHKPYPTSPIQGPIASSAVPAFTGIVVAEEAVIVPHEEIRLDPLEEVQRNGDHNQ